MIKTDPFVFTGSQDDMLTCYVVKSVLKGYSL
jgi:hypothetical protein